MEEQTPQDPDTIPYAWLHKPPTDLDTWKRQLEAQSMADHFISAKRWLAGMPALRHLPYELHADAFGIMFDIARKKYFTWDRNRKTFIFSSYLKAKADYAAKQN